MRDVESGGLMRCMIPYVVDHWRLHPYTGLYRLIQRVDVDACDALRDAHMERAPSSMLSFLLNAITALQLARAVCHPTLMTSPLF